ncbi:MAG: hypothetical protein QM785_06655 [Pyrinomonadaceae bacterium]
MELEFDKEMDAILRRARADRGVLVGDDPPEKTKHIDADSIAAFVENALPAKTRTLYMAHFADCDRCRRILSQSMLMFSEADVKAASVVSAPVVESVAVPWYQKLFRTPNLAIAMGALLLVFGGFFAFSVIQKRQADQNASVAQVSDDERQKGGPFLNDESANKSAAAANTAPAMTNTAANAAALPAPNAVPDPLATPGEPSAEKRAMSPAKPSSVATAGESPDSGVVSRDEDKLAEESRPMTKGAPPPPPAPTMLGGAPATERESKKEVDDKKNKDDVSTADSTMMRKQAEPPRGRDLPPSPSKSGPVRSGPINTQTNQIQNQIFDMPVTRIVSGKTFRNSGGVWYDSTYKSQATLNYRRGAAEYKKLDSGLRNIADTIGGTVVLVWKGKAYRVQ